MTIKEILTMKREENISKLINGAIDSIKKFALKQYGDLTDTHYEVKMGIVKGEKSFEIRLFYEVNEINDMRANNNDGFIVDFDSTSYEVAEEFAQKLVAELFKQGVTCKPSDVHNIWDLKINLL